ncbi:hypothetical protein MLP_34180 [Microlunatus phosphovorus NM-1]|uniref:Uncharacterized protein n=1 Tax=Microlunatus phosphovorus (strain ATCC 700054 / DSM 10555 / JCM 9379 / NBRC 101784 / NCIMB 13414 / VKM Ac-1990 / NM-1) TaxID=1032480 RepID=F5XMH5_MICPN|nr:hypothetical protein MLP_34180 [Microlunatus phosphovorus NM-1]
MLDVVGVAGQNQVAGTNDQGEVGVGNVSRATQAEKFADPAGFLVVDLPDGDAAEYTGESGLPRTRTPDLCYHRDARHHPDSVLLSDPQSCANTRVAPIGSDQRTGVENECHQALGGAATPSERAAASRSAGLKGPSSASHWSSAAPSISFRSWSPAALLSQRDTLTPDRDAAARTA